MITYKARVNYSWASVEDMDWIKDVFDSRFNWNADIAFLSFNNAASGFCLAQLFYSHVEDQLYSSVPGNNKTD